MVTPNKINSENQFELVKELIREDSDAVDHLIRKNLHSDVTLISQVSEYIINSGGKRVRPLITLLVAKALKYSGKDHIQTAAIIEFIHTATLLHDDVVDESKRRRGQDTANIIFGNQASVLIGDFLYSRAFQMMVKLDEMKVLRVLADTTNTIATGEVMQLINIHDPNIDEENYTQVIYRKTACLFEASGHAAAILANSDEKERLAMIEYGKQLGIAFQLIDDALDYSASSEILGKNLGDDLAEGKPTLPIIYAIKNSSQTEKNIIQKAIENGDLTKLSIIQEIIKSTGAIKYTVMRAQQAADRAIKASSMLPESSYKEALISIANFAVQRQS
ncbi:MAG: octaprenyl-diphosphate synthase [Woeseiaceae bacterium]|jgi:octaprenyl-diphosphate synthase|tara:strand:+ start:634 stop:1632 length:999 start_codon:yes stop_codon:yes gene_type:complete